EYEAAAALNDAVMERFSQVRFDVGRCAALCVRVAIRRGLGDTAGADADVLEARAIADTLSGPVFLLNFVDNLRRSDELDASATELRILQHTLIQKNAGPNGAIGLHDDRRYVGFLDPPHVMSVRLALEAEDQDTGAMWVVAGSHRWGLDDTYDVFGEQLVDLASEV